ncbi:tetratricopeptide repeat protein [Marinicella rhabdoformis]|uniref:tetratricopeptide repeat protein n=1 Tax=Marinicella rhabdoformis TaxID=2580566 RepID=UPI0012AEC607|nr:tetratricopeptide repeat protein [Marinicella rhabdoformis]
MKKLAVLLVLAIMLSACQNTKPNVDEAVRNPSDQHGSVIDVKPMLPDAVWSLVEQAEQFKVQAAFEQAISTLQRALRIAPNSPLVQQHLAEMHLAEGDYQEAMQWSEKVVKHGPQYGQLCQRARRVVSLSAEMLGLVDKQAQALESIALCVQKAQPRY